MALVERQIAVGLISGTGSTFLELYKATQGKSEHGSLDHTEMAAVISNHPEKSFDIFKKSDFPWDRYLIMRPQDYRTPEEYGEAIIRIAKRFGADIIGQWGHTPKTSANVIAEFPQKMINQHPGPIDPSPYDFGGKGMSSAERVHAARLQFVMDTNRNWWTDVVAQRVAASFDGGRVLKRERVLVRPDDTPEALGDRAKPFEYRAQIGVLHDFEEGTVVELPPYPDLVLPSERLLLQKIKDFVRHHYKAD